MPSVRTLVRIAEAAGFELVIGLRRPGTPPPDPHGAQRDGVRAPRYAHTERGGQPRRLHRPPRTLTARGPAL